MSLLFSEDVEKCEVDEKGQRLTTVKVLSVATSLGLSRFGVLSSILSCVRGSGFALSSGKAFQALAGLLSCLVPVWALPAPAPSAR